MDTETEERSLKYWLVLVAVLSALVVFGLVDSESAQWLMAGTFWGMILAGVAMNRARRESARTDSDTAAIGQTVDAKLSHPAQVCPSTTKIERVQVLKPNPGQLRIREVTHRTVHGRAQIAPSDPALQMTAEQRQAISDHVRLSNESAVEKARRRSVASTPAPAEQLDALDSPQARGAEVLPRPSEQQSSQDATEIKRAQDIALRRALANLAAASRGRRADRRTQIERDVAALEQRGTPVEEVIIELQRLERQVAAEVPRHGFAR
jgi:hypothetical protein